MKKKELTVIWNKHGEGSLVGVFDDLTKVEKLKDIFEKSGQTHYMGIYSTTLNELNQHALAKDLPRSIKVGDDF